MVRLGQIVLFTLNKQRLSSFLCDLFDLDVEINNESLRVYNSSLDFLLIENPNLEKTKTNSLLDIHVDSYDDLIELKNNIEFINYRYAQSADSTEMIITSPEIKDLGKIKFFFMTDPDGRNWKISFVE